MLMELAEVSWMCRRLLGKGLLHQRLAIIKFPVNTHAVMFSPRVVICLRCRLLTSAGGNRTMTSTFGIR